MSRPLIVGIGGTTRPGSSTDRALRHALAAVRAAGCDTRLFDGEFLKALPHYDPDAADRSAAEQDLVETVRRAGGLVIATPAYHGGVSGLVKNAIDLLQETAGDARPYLDGLPVGLVVTAYGWQATGTTLASLRSIIHALRGWPTPMGVAINTGASRVFSEQGECIDDAVAAQLSLVATQVASFAQKAAVSDAALAAAQ